MRILFTTAENAQDGKRLDRSARALHPSPPGPTMRRLAIALFTLAFTILCGWIAIELGWLGEMQSAPPGGGAAIHTADAGAPEIPARTLPTSLPDAESAREPVSRDRPRGPSGSLIVRVTDRASGKRVDGASLALDPAEPVGNSPAFAERSDVLRNASGESDAVTDELGEARIEVSSGIRMRLRVRDRGPSVGRSDHSIEPLAPGEQRVVEVDLPRGLDLEHWVRAVAGTGGAPVVGASVRLIFAGTPLQSPADSPPDPAPGSLTDAEGLARLRVPSWRTALARIDAAGFGSRIAAVVPGHDAPPRAQVVALARSASLSLVVTSTPGVPLADASVVLSLSAAEIAIPRGTSVLAGDLAWTARTDEQGRCRFEDLPPEVPIRAEVRRGPAVLHRCADAWSFAPGERAERSVCLGGTARLLGLLLGPDSAPVAESEVWLARAPAAEAPASADRYFWTGTLEVPFAKVRTDEAGSFTFEGLEPGDWWVGPSPVRASAAAEEEGSIAPRAELVRLPAGTKEIEVVLRSSLGRWIRGQVLDPDGMPVAQTVVEARAVDALGSPATRTGTDGRFALGPLADGAFLVRARGRWGFSDSAEAKARAGDRELVLRLSPGATLKGRAIDRETGAPCVATLHLSSRLDSSGAERRAAIASAGRDGSFAFRGLVPDTYDLVARAEDGRIGFVRDVVARLGEDGAPTLVALAPGARLRIRNEGKAVPGRFAVLSEGRVFAEGSAGAGESVLVVLPPGPWTVRFTAGSGVAEERRIEARAGAGETEVVFSAD